MAMAVKVYLQIAQMMVAAQKVQCIPMPKMKLAPNAQLLY
jgi:hypothetical protein